MIIYGKNPVGEAVKAGKTIDKLYILREESDARMSALVKAAKERGAVVVNADRRQLDKLTDGGNHQGIAAQVTDFEYCSVEDILAEAGKLVEAGFHESYSKQYLTLLRGKRFPEESAEELKKLVEEEAAFSAPYDRCEEQEVLRKKKH